MKPEIALAGWLLYMAVALGWRSWLQWRRTGDAGFRGLSGNVGSIEWLAGVCLLAGSLLGGIAPVLVWARATPMLVDLDALVPVGATALAGGLVLTVAAQLEMGASWRIGVDPTERTRLVTHGLYRWMRNPIFTGMLLASAGMLLLLPSVPTVAGLTLVLAGLEVHVRRVEEPYLLAAHGDAYRSYARGAGRFVPGIGRLA